MCLCLEEPLLLSLAVLIRFYCYFSVFCASNLDTVGPKLSKMLRLVIRACVDTSVKAIVLFSFAL